MSGRDKVGTKLSELRNGCFHMAMDHEPMFVLLARDPAAPGLVRKWADERRAEIDAGQRPATDLSKVLEALSCAQSMEAWRVQNDGAWRQPLFGELPQVPPEHSEETSARVASIAARLMNHPDPDVRAVAASALTQAPDRV